MAEKLNLSQELEYYKSLVGAKIIPCKHQIYFEDFCLICKEIVSEKKG